MWHSRHARLGNSRASHARLTAVGVAVWYAVAASPAGADATAYLTVRAQVSSGTSLNVSTDRLHFDILPNVGSATATVDFSAAARTHGSGDVLLSIETLIPVGLADDSHDPALTFTGEGEGTGGGDLTATGPHPAARWMGSGRRTGRLVFTLRSRAGGSYTIPVRFVLTAP